MRITRYLILLLLIATITANAQDLRESVCVVKAEYPIEVKNKLSDYALWLSRKGFTHESQVLSAYKNGVTGSGVVINTARGRVVLTNRHVLGYAPSATISFVLRGTTYRFHHCEILNTYKDADLALVALPDSCIQPALMLATDTTEDGQDIVAIGFPDLAGKPSWQITKGVVSNAYLQIDNTDHFYIQHTAQIDPGSSGGPLLIKTDSGYEIIGINTLKAFRRDNVGLAIPTSVIRHVIDKSDSALIPDYKFLENMSLNGEMWGNMIDNMNKSCIDSLRKMPIEMPLDVLNNTLALDCKTEVKEGASKKTAKSLNSQSIYDSDFGNYFYVRMEYHNALSRTQQVDIAWESNRSLFVYGVVASLILAETRENATIDNEERISSMRPTFGVGFRLGTQVPLHMGKYYSIPRFAVTPTFTSGWLKAFSGKSKNIATLPFSIGNNFAFPVGYYLLSVGVHYTYDISFYTDTSFIITDNNLRVLKTGGFASMTGKSSLGISLSFGW